MHRERRRGEEREPLPCCMGDFWRSGGMPGLVKITLYAPDKVCRGRGVIKAAENGTHPQAPRCCCPRHRLKSGPSAAVPTVNRPVVGNHSTPPFLFPSSLLCSSSPPFLFLFLSAPLPFFSFPANSNSFFSLMLLSPRSSLNM